MYSEEMYTEEHGKLKRPQAAHTLTNYPRHECSFHRCLPDRPWRDYAPRWQIRE
jgi:hypothetical protein